MSRVRVASILLSSRTDARASSSRLLAVLALPACHGTPRPAGAPTGPAVSTTVQLQRDIEAVLAVPALDAQLLGDPRRSARTDDTLYSLNAGKLLMPGSTMKIVTLAAAAERARTGTTCTTRA